MPLRSRAAALAAFTASIVSLALQSAPGLAAEVPTLPGVATSQLAVTDAVPATSAPDSADQILDQDSAAQADDEVAYPTLAAAVADQSIPSNTDEDMRCLAGAIYFESRGEPLTGQLAVAEVILNRTKSRRFGGSVCDVITQKGQFSFVRGGVMPAAPSNDDWRTAMAVAKVAMKDAWETDASNALYFHHRSTGRAAGQRVASIGNHVFFR
ncbi:cell wall hydrolase [Sphingomonas sp. RHCKR7]|uniref:cell wall hydrolase n=1 Tax=Sphingomonas folli TaxID=2862497 RepID=UPI001C67D32A|nr:cell wall hydrolase [Sphingomonas folli]MBW6528064.1 cell wall hydrolase [Sphingomonas folli]